jgi:hypothetical protein
MDSYDVHVRPIQFQLYDKESFWTFNIRDRPFNLKGGGGGGGYGFLFRSEFLFSDNTRVRIFFFVAQSVIFFPEFNIRLNDKNSESYYFFFLHQNQNIFFSNIGNQNILFRKKT